MSSEDKGTKQLSLSIDRRNLLLGTSAFVTAVTLASDVVAQAQKAAPAAAPAAAQPAAAGRKPNILFIMGDDIGWFNVSAYNMGMMGYRTPNIDRIGREGAVFTDWYGQGVPAACQGGEFHRGRCDGEDIGGPAQELTGINEDSGLTRGRCRDGRRQTIRPDYSMHRSRE